MPDLGAGAVDGVVLNPDGVRVAGVKVSIGGTIATTDAQGRFSVPDAPASYDAVLLVSGNVFAFEGMTTRTPSLRGFGDRLLATGWRQTDVVQTVPDGTTAMVIAAKQIGSGAPQFAATPYANGGVGIGWQGSTSVDVQLIAVEYVVDHGTGAITSYTGYATTNVTLTAGEDTYPWSITWQSFPYGQATVGAAIGGPASDWQGSASISMHLVPGDSGYPLGRVQLAGPTFSILAPELPGASFDLALQAQETADPLGHQIAVTESGLTPGADPARVGVVQGPLPVAPDDGAAASLLSTEFTWTGDGRATELDLRADDAAQPWFRIYAAGGSAHVPDASELGVATKADVAYTWYVSEPSDSTTVDALASRPDTVWGWNAPGVVAWTAGGRQFVAR